MKRVKEFLGSWGLIIIVPLIIFSFFGGCSTKRNAQKSVETTEELKVVVDSLNQELATRPTLKEVRDEMEEVMLDFLIYEDELDKKQITISQIKDKIEAND